MKNFIERFGKSILGVVHGFDRIRFRGTRRFLANVNGMLAYLWQRHVLLKDFKAFAGNITAQVRQAAEEVATSQGRPVRYLHNSDMDKEAWARELAQRDRIHQGLIGVLKSVERCWSYEVGPNRGSRNSNCVANQASACTTTITSMTRTSAWSMCVCKPGSRLPFMWA